MKTVFRVTTVVFSLVLLLWGGVAVPAETPTVPESPEYLMGAIEAYPSWGVADVVASDQMEVATARSYRTSETEGAAEPLHAWQQYYLGVPNAPEPVPARGTVEYLAAMDEGTLPSQPFEPNPPVMVAVPAEGTWEYSNAMETGSLPSTCGDEPCAAEAFTIIEVGGIPYRLEVDFGGN